MSLSESVLYLLARLLYRSEIANSADMKKALSTRNDYEQYRFARVDHVLSAAIKYGVDITDKVALDLGCNDGVMTTGYSERGVRVIGLTLMKRLLNEPDSDASPAALHF